ncbi:MAG: DMT family transporter [Mycobacteriales bacterium]
MSSAEPVRPVSAVGALPPALDAGLLAVALVGLSTSGPLIAAAAAPPLAIAFWRNGLASAVLLPFSLVRRRAEFRAMPGRSWRLSALSGVLLAAHFGLWIPSLSLTSVASSTALVAVQPVWAAIFARLAGQRVPRTVWLGIGVAVTGAALLAGVDLDVSARALAGDLLALAGGALAAAYVSVGSTVRAGTTATAYTCICYSTCAALLLAACLIGRQHLAGYDAGTWAKIVGLTVGAQLLGHSLVNLVLRSASATVVSLAILFEVPGASLIAALWLHQVPGPSSAAGLGVLLVGTAVVIVTSVRLARPDPAV